MVYMVLGNFEKKKKKNWPYVRLKWAWKQVSAPPIKNQPIP